FAAPTYVSDGTGWGASEGAVIAYRLTNQFGLYGGFGFNHTDDTTQFLGTVGVQRFGNPYGRDLSDRASFSFLFDQFSDSQTDSYESQFRIQAGYVLAPRTEIGALVTAQGDSDAGGQQIPLGGIGNVTNGDNFIGPYASTSLGRGSKLFGTVGYSEQSDDIAGGAGAFFPVSSNASSQVRGFVDAKYAGNGNNDDSMALSMGLAWGFGRADSTDY
ncbi:MAG: hypothetical protein KDA37_12940, partial [Planctomycetales bacterium]|nr:hypothetical protein [Planctomycetales bacterium]